MLVLGGGIAGVWAAIAAARCGARVTILEKAATVRSGAGGAGVDHWQWAADNPASGVRPEELAQALIDNQGGYRNGISTHMQCASAYETLLDMERMGGKVRDVDDEYAGAEFRDEAMKLLRATSASGSAFASSTAPRPPACSPRAGATARAWSAPPG